MSRKILPIQLSKGETYGLQETTFYDLFISAVFLVSIQRVGLAQPDDNTKIYKQDTSPKEIAVDQQVETKRDREIRPVQGLRILELSENPARMVTKAADPTRKEPAPTVATDN